MCGGGGNAAKIQAQQEQQRQDTISGNVGKIDAAFANRQGDYDKYKGALQKQYQTELDRQQGIATRNSKFALARSGVTGGSQAVDAGTLLSQEEAQGTVNAQQQVQSGVSKLQNQDEATRQQMISLAQSGGDIGNAAIQTGNQLQANLGQAQNTNVAAGLGDAFSGITSSYNNEQQAAALRKGLLAGNTYAKSSDAGSLGGP